MFLINLIRKLMGKPPIPPVPMGSESIPILSGPAKYGWLVPNPPNSGYFRVVKADGHRLFNTRGQVMEQIHWYQVYWMTHP